MTKSEIKLGPRNDPLGLARRSLRNLELIEQTFASHNEGHVVTQLVQSLLAFLVFPKERNLLDSLKTWRLDQLRDEGWPSLIPHQDDEHDTHTLYDVFRHMRNAICHGGIKFYGEGPDGPDSRHVEEVAIEFSDRNKREQPIDWQLEIAGKDLRKLIILIENTVFR